MVVDAVNVTWFPIHREVPEVEIETVGVITKTGSAGDVTEPQGLVALTS